LPIEKKIIPLQPIYLQTYASKPQQHEISGKYCQLRYYPKPRLKRYLGQ
jgi:hypothetical protein